MTTRVEDRRLTHLRQLDAHLKQDLLQLQGKPGATALRFQTKLLVPIVVLASYSFVLTITFNARVSTAFPNVS
jgi:hypothetical protein